VTQGSTGSAVSWWAERAWLGGDQVAERVLISTDGQPGGAARITAVLPGIDPPARARRLEGLVLPGMANAHSHAFHRALRGRTHGGRGDFWTWRDAMYALAARLEPDSYLRLARAVYAEMALAGITTVGEFHYLHHPARGRYSDPNEMGRALVAAAAAVGIRITLLDACYLQADVDGTPLEGVQHRFSDGGADTWAARATALASDVGGTGGVGDGADARLARVGAAIHSVRAVPPAAMEVVAAWAGEREAPLHLHLSEQPLENQACLAVTGRTPARLAADSGVLSARTTAVHATHLSAGDLALLGGSRTGACICPTTERDLGDGIGPARRLLDAGCPLSLGSDGHSVIDLFEEARAVELDERLATGKRGLHRPPDLLEAATAGGALALGWADAGRIAPGQLADLVAVRLDSPRLAGAPDSGAGLLAAVVFGATAADVTEVVAGGRRIVSGGGHLLVGDVGGALTEAVTEAVGAVST
jgi:formiminoglutamate deiminase